MLMNYHIGRLVLSSLCVGDFAAAEIWCSKNSNTQRNENKTTDVVIHQHSRRLLKMDILMSETYWAHNKWNKVASDIKLVFHSSAMLKFIHRFHFCSGIKMKLVPFPSSGKINESYVLGSTKSIYCPYSNWHNVARRVGIICEMFNTC